MPELPEVETIRGIIEPQIQGLKIKGVDVCNRQIIAYPTPDKFVETLLGRTFICIKRRGKFLIFQMDNGDKMILHLRMTGQLLVTPPDYPQEKHTHLLIHLENGNQIRYIDVRRFGRFWYIEKDEKESIAGTGIDKLGPEPFDKELTAEYLIDKLAKRKKCIKEMLHEQSIVAGIGNIYSDEILYAAGIYPAAECSELTVCDWERLAQTIPETLRWATEKNQITPEEYLEGKGKEYRNTPYLRAYGHAGKECSVCGSTFERMTVGGRSCCYCPKCQKHIC